MLNAMHLYRMGRWLYERRVPVLPKMLYVAGAALFHSIVPFTARIGKGCRFTYGGLCVIVHKDAQIGENVVISPCATIGGRFEPGHPPVIGDNVFIATGAKILGVRVGSNVIIGANSVVTRDVPSGTVVAGVPARVLREIRPEELRALRQRLVKADPEPNGAPVAKEAA